MRRHRLLGFVLASLLVGSARAEDSSMKINPSLFHQRWPARWVAHPEGPAHDYGVFHFRKRFDLNRVPARFVVHVSADNRYRLFVNGQSVSWGPARGDLHNWRFETVDLAPYLRRGQNVVAAVVWNFGDVGPWAQMTARTAFVLQGDGETERVLDTRAGNGWKVLRNDAYRPIPVRKSEVPFFSVVGPGDSVVAAKYPWGWETLDFDDRAWLDVVDVAPASPRGVRIPGSPWWLVPRLIPPMEETEQRFAAVRHATGVDVPVNFVEGSAPLVVPAHAKIRLVLDQGELTTAYPELVVSRGRGARVRVTYAEAAWKGREKGNRNVIEGKQIRGYSDEFVLDGGDERHFKTLWWRTFRYVQLDIQTADEPLTIEDYRSWYTGYPFREKGRFESDDPTLVRIWQVGWHTARLCAQETYTDCPYYEQLQYVGDTRVQALVSLYVSGDDRLMRKAIRQFDDSRLPDGLTQSRYPSRVTQVIPPFSLYWVNMLHDYWMYRDDEAFVRNLLPGTRTVLTWFWKRLDEKTGLLGPLEWWNFVDWAPQYREGVPPGTDQGGSAIVTLQFVWALQDAAELEKSLGDPCLASEYRKVADKSAQAVYRLCWDEKRGLLANSPTHDLFSQHANILGVLTDAIPPERQRGVVQKLLNDSTLVQATYYFRFYLHWAVRKVGLGDRYLDLLQPWREMLDLGLTTWAETPEPTRSDCHAWSAHPNIDLLATVCGIRPAEPGFRKVLVEPFLGELQRVNGVVPHPQGTIRVSLERAGSAGLRVVVSLPNGVPGVFRWRGQQRELHPGQNRFVL